MEKYYNASTYFLVLPILYGKWILFIFQLPPHVSLNLIKIVPLAPIPMANFIICQPHSS